MILKTYLNLSWHIVLFTSLACIDDLKMLEGSSNKLQAVISNILEMFSVCIFVDKTAHN